MLQSINRPYKTGDVVHFSTYARKLDICIGTIERLQDSADFDPSGVNVRFFYIREARTGELYSTARELIHGFVYS